MEKFGRREWLMKWHLWKKMRLGIWWSFSLKNPFEVTRCSRRRLRKKERWRNTKLGC